MRERKSFVYLSVVLSFNQRIMGFTKAMARAWANKQREEISTEEVLLRSLQIFDQMASYWPLSSWQNVHLFLPIESKKEVNTWKLIDTIRQKHPEICLYIPRMESQAQMTHHLFTKSTPLITNAWGITEPAPESVGLTTPIFWETVVNPVVLVPLLYLDKRGYRVGYGKGFYDRFLATEQPHTRIGLSIFEPGDTPLDVDAFDIPVQFCATPNKIWTF